MTMYESSKHKVAIFLVSGLFALPFHVQADPVVSAVVLQDTMNRISVFGKDFGSKKQAAPILVDRVDIAYENGLKNSVYSDVDGSEAVIRSTDSNESLWEKSSLNVHVDSTRVKRHPASRSHYFFEGENNFLGWPNAYGGLDTPADNRQLYVSWWYKPKVDPGSYWAFTTETLIGTFQESETLLVEGGYEGVFLGIDSDGLINAGFSGVSKQSLVGARIEGEKSGATVTFPTEFRGGSGSGFETPGSQKFLRIWEDPYGKDGIRFSWTQMHQTGMGVVNWDSQPLKGNQWNHLEVELDTVTGRVALAINGNFFGGFDFDPARDAEGKWSPTVAALGLNGKVGKLQEGEIDDIYIDRSLQRVIIGDSPEYSKLTQYEVQRPISWEDGEIELALFLGEFEDRGTLGGLYVYVFDDQGNVNQKGYEICEDCKAPPSSTPLIVE
ncbi:hypothetical protein SAMN04487881_2250 [Marinobacter sp. es.048]|uniref:hypothetical protein n=1 Tax=Marinobacter sp. es.048 TaxID=1761795 RepID=UPI000B64C6AC|nr:hypothetical protein [Marinobacter sp. es.048]SNC68263.1 hypothetical protein SAMN04487881_2233 [Marinobacter sp. es.048]SNC74353.1 hypothetical protein SAMN04487881_2250 [Marinobacter sp. es.048]